MSTSRDRLRLGVGAGLCLFVLCLDGCLKHWASVRLGHRGATLLSHPLYVGVRFHRNPGTVAGFGGDLRWPCLTGFVLLVAILAACLWTWPRFRQRACPGAGLVLGGAMSNSIDRLAFGSVRDYLSVVCSSGVFNLADVALVMGFLQIVLAVTRQPHKRHLGWDEPARQGGSQ